MLMSVINLSYYWRHRQLVFHSCLQNANGSVVIYSNLQFRRLRDSLVPLMNPVVWCVGEVMVCVLDFKRDVGLWHGILTVSLQSLSVSLWYTMQCNKVCTLPQQLEVLLHSSLWMLLIDDTTELYLVFFVLVFLIWYIKQFLTAETSTAP